MTFPIWSLFLFPILPRFKHLLLLTDRQERGRRRCLWQMFDDSIGSIFFALKENLW
jgi:hypothetical protein